MRRLLVLSCLVLAACGGGGDDAPRTEDRDPMVAAAVGEPLMADPDLANQNQGGAALTGGGPASAEIPPFKRSKDEIDAARAAAQQIFGKAIPAAPNADDEGGPSRLDKAVSAPAIARALAIGSAACAERLDYSAIWAARLAPPFEVYPRGHVGQSAGTDQGGCRLRVVGFVTPVAAEDVIAFYAARANALGYSLRRIREGDDDVLHGKKGAAAYAVAVRAGDDKLSEVTLVTSGL